MRNYYASLEIEQHAFVQEAGQEQWFFNKLNHHLNTLYTKEKECLCRIVLHFTRNEESGYLSPSLHLTKYDGLNSRQG